MDGISSFWANYIWWMIVIGLDIFVSGDQKLESSICIMNLSHRCRWILVLYSLQKHAIMTVLYICSLSPTSETILMRCYEIWLGQCNANICRVYTNPKIVYICTSDSSDVHWMEFMHSIEWNTITASYYKDRGICMIVCLYVPCLLMSIMAK